MRIFIYSLKILIVVCALLWITGQSCKQPDANKEGTDSLAIRESITSSPVISPAESINKMHLEDGFAVKLVAAEPLITAPVAMTFDKEGRIWVLQMNDYMPDTLGTGEDKPSGKVVILSDKNGDGLMDDRKIFLDSLVLPRAICLIEDGILVAEPPKLWYYKIENDKPVKKTLVDASYAEGGNVEHQPNGLIRALDNWIYSAKSAKRYRKKGDKWLIERTHFRGQWGISQDDYGRLFYNNNSENLLGDEFTPGLGATNANQKRVSGFNKKIVNDNKVYPARPTTGVNRGYMKGVLDDSLRLVNFTAACGPVIYNGNLFDKEYYGNAFVAEPSANLVKRNIVTSKGYVVEGRQAYSEKEFLASEDERFRPVSLYNGPDGALYVVDLYRGIIQHKTYLTPYLKNEIKERELTKPLNCGRIYKIVPAKKNLDQVRIPTDTSDLLTLLKHPNGWIRNEAQQLLVDGKYTSAAPTLRSYLKQPDEPLQLIHSLWIMEGLGVLQLNDVLPLLTADQWPIRMQALSVVPSIISKKNYQQLLPVLQQMINGNDTLAAPYIAFLLNSFRAMNAAATNDLLLTLTKQYGSNVYVADAIISNLQNKEAVFYKQALKINPDTSIALNKRLKKVIADIAAAKNNSNAKKLEKEFPKGAAIFQSVCQNCHGKDGNGIASLAPPLNNSEWVKGDKNRLIPIVLYGLTGPVKVDGKLYKAPEINGDMPGVFENKEFSDADLAQLLNLIRNSWNNKGEKITEEDIKNTRNKHKGRMNPFNAEELQNLK
jgi:mono/diheme cytochrome c family protein/glucose/arabinose dehydrogenase